MNRAKVFLTLLRISTIAAYRLAFKQNWGVGDSLTLTCTLDIRGDS